MNRSDMSIAVSRPTVNAAHDQGWVTWVFAPKPASGVASLTNVYAVCAN